MKRSKFSALISRRAAIKAATGPLAFAALAASGSPPFAADDYPGRPVRIVVPLAAGGGTDLLARLIAADISEALGQTFVVDNRPGAGTQIGAEMAAKSAPDGYTLLSASMTTYAFNPVLYTKLKYDPVRDYAPISLTGRFALVLLANPAFPPKSVQELIGMAKSKPGEINFASSGPGSPHHLAMELFATRAQLKLVHVPYKGAAPALQDVIAGHVPMMITDYASAKQAISSGMVKVLAVCSLKRMQELPDVPTFVESGFPGFEAAAWQGIVAPNGTPAMVVTKLNAAIVKALGKPAVREKLAAIGVEPISSTPEEFSAYMVSEITKWRQVTKAASITLD